MGIATESIDDNAEGHVTTFGVVNGIDLSLYSIGDVLYVSPITPGAFTKIRPPAPFHAVQVGQVIRNQNNGALIVSINSGSEISELHDVLLNSTQNGNVLRYNSLSGIWENSDLSNEYVTLSTSQNISGSKNFTSPISAVTISANLSGSRGLPLSGVDGLSPITILSNQITPIPAIALNEDFVGNAPNYSWGNISSGGGAISYPNNVSYSRAHGIQLCTTSTVANNIIGSELRSGSTPNFGFRYSVCFAVGDVTSCGVRLGLSDTLGAGFFLRTDNGGNFYLWQNTLGTLSTLNSTSPTNGNFNSGNRYHFIMELKNANTIYVYLAVAAHNSGNWSVIFNNDITTPTYTVGALNPYHYIQTLTNAARTLFVDWVTLSHSLVR